MSKRLRTCLKDILVKGGIRPVIAARIERAIDADDYIGLTGDDVASALLRWSHREADEAFSAGALFGGWEDTACPNPLAIQSHPLKN
jgi:hypothetical protein